MAKSYDVIVVGAGPGGVCCAALLAKRGLKVLVLDKNERVGGKTMRVSVKGFQCEMWPTGGLPVRGGSWLEAFRALAIESRFNAVLKDIGLAYQHYYTHQRAVVTPGQRRQNRPKKLRGRRRAAYLLYLEHTPPGRLLEVG